MAQVKPLLGEIELQLVQQLEVDGSQILAEHSVPALEGDFLQGLGRRATRIALSGVLTGTEAGKGLKDLREKFRAAEPVSFVADISTATKVDKVIIEEMVVRDLAGKPERFEYAFTLREFIPPPAATTEEPPKLEIPKPPDDAIDRNTGTLRVEIVIEGQASYDYSAVEVRIEGTKQDGSALSRTLTNHTDNTWTEEDFPAGDYTINVSDNSQSMSGSAPITIETGQTEQLTIPLQAVSSNIAKTFVVHFRMDNSFIEPAMCQVLKRVADHALSNPNEKLIILGHTDLVGSDEYNQNLSERRARSVYAFLTVGGDDAARQAAVNEWNTLRQSAPQSKRDIQDNWGTREYQFMLQALERDQDRLSYYYGNIDGVHGPKTAAAVSVFQEDYELTSTAVSYTHLTLPTKRIV